MKKIVNESLSEFLNEIAYEKTKKAKKVVQTKIQRANEAIAALKKQLADIKKPGGAKSTLEKNTKIKEIEEKIKKWEAKKK